MQGRAGASLLECTVTLVLLGYGLAAIAATTTASLRTVREAGIETLATDAGRQVLDSLALHETPVADSLSLGSMRAGWVVTRVASGWRFDVAINDAGGRVRFVTGGRAARWPRRISVLP
ncbi:MAG: hypothetical protein L0271_01910 [Gemmatimonadetes bacterium]|nr:hypothetical protein [Gemmatimonadota bacterium]